MELREAINKRRCIRKFKSKSVGSDIVLGIIESATKAPCAGGVFSVRAILVDDQDKKNGLAEACLEQDFIAKAPYLIVVCSETKQTKKLYGKFAQNYIKQQAGAAIENMFLTIIDRKLSTCWVGAFDEGAIKRILEIPDDVDVEAVLPVGYSDEEPKEKFHPELNMVLRKNSYKIKPYKVKKKLET